VHLRAGARRPAPGQRPDAPLPTGPRLSALAAYLTVFQHVPVERAQLLIADLAGSALSAGFVHSCLRKAAGLAAEPVRLIRALIAASPVAGFDETTLRSAPQERRTTSTARSPSCIPRPIWAPAASRP
jgi:transposase